MDRARDQHRHHGLQLKLDPLPKTSTRIEHTAQALRAAPLERANGERFGTFELWHRTAREAPLGGAITQRDGGGRLQSFGVLLQAANERMLTPPSSGVSLLDCLVRIPGLAPFFRLHGITVPIVRGRAGVEVDLPRKTEVIKLWFHPAAQDVWQEFSEAIKFRACDLERISIVSNPVQNACVVRIEIREGEDVPFQLPHCASYGMDDVRFWSDQIGLNEFGLFYTALYIVGNYARYYPDRWIADIERSTPLALAVEQLLSEATVRAPLLTWSELSQCYWVPGRL